MWPLESIWPFVCVCLSVFLSGKVWCDPISMVIFTAFSRHTPRRPPPGAEFDGASSHAVTPPMSPDSGGSPAPSFAASGSTFSIDRCPRPRVSAIIGSNGGFLHNWCFLSTVNQQWFGFGAFEAFA